MTGIRATIGVLSQQDTALALLALGAGCIDVLAFVRLGGALPSAMTGNTALLGLTLGRGRLADALPFLLAFCGFVGGTAAATAASNIRPDDSVSRRIVRLLAHEAVLLVGFAILWQLAPRPVNSGMRDGLILLAAAGMGVQGVAARLAARFGINTIVFTSTLSAITSSIISSLLSRPRALKPDTLRQLAIFAVYFTGALLAGIALSSGIRTIAVLPSVTVIGAIFLYRRF
jgi:uncharacterized membrane protein YoaK (UPF0700 family)